MALAKGQSAIEFLSTYSFVFLILAGVLVLLVFLASSGTALVPAQCSSFGGVDCNFASFYTNGTEHYSLVTLGISNSGSVPINVIGMTVTRGAVTENAFCTPSFVYPGGQAVCAAQFSTVVVQGTMVNGYYSLSADYCNNGLSEILLNDCAAPATYTGSFSAQATYAETDLFGVIGAVGANTVTLAPYNSITVPFLPPSYSTIQNGEWIGTGSGGSVAYSFGTQSYIGSNYLGVNTLPFPASVSQLNDLPNANAPYNSLFSMAFTTLDIAVTQNSERIYTDNAMEVYYKPVTSGSWNSVFGGDAWTGGSDDGGEHTGNVVLQPGMYNLAVVWSNTAANGLQALNIS